ncbi:MAG TPA: type II toxin-antitoxin system CcdA family antitoxin [Kofleriaceae bacterium]|nr:type II toxin-antitoxin system CcdA family antitoxin [Kofleriaceae bacterium]
MARAPAHKPRRCGTPGQPVRPMRTAQEQWLAENERAIEQYNAFVERYGAFSDDFRLF